MIRLPSQLPFSLDDMMIVPSMNSGCWPLMVCDQLVEGYMVHGFGVYAPDHQEYLYYYVYKTHAMHEAQKWSP